MARNVGGQEARWRLGLPLFLSTSSYARAYEMEGRPLCEEQKTEEEPVKELTELDLLKEVQ